MRDEGESALAAAMSDAAGLVEQALDMLLPVPAGPERRLTEAMRYAALGGGKRLRAFLVIQGSSLFAVAPAGAARVAASVEMIHAYSLVHDDLPALDNDDLRRGKPTAHRAFDEATAIIAGDALQARAFEVLADPQTHPDPMTRCELVTALALASGAHGMAGGQMMDMLAPELSRSGNPLGGEQVSRLQALKTGRLIQFAAEAGAIMGHADGPARHALVSYGRDLGTAFQIADDLLDVEGTAEALGKAAGKDAASGKATLVAILGPERARAQAGRLAVQAAGHLERFGGPASMLRALAAFVVNRRN